jgi:DNA-binding transcriptional ArsR family regulator
MNVEMKSTSPVEFAKALADPTRQEIMSLICCRELSVGVIVEAVGVSQPTVSHHLAILKEAGLVSIRNEGKHAYYTLKPTIQPKIQAVNKFSFFDNIHR